MVAVTASSAENPEVAAKSPLAEVNAIAGESNGAGAKDAATNGHADGSNSASDDENNANGASNGAMEQRAPRARKGGKGADSATNGNTANGEGKEADGEAPKKTRTFYLVRLPRPEENLTGSVKIEAELEVHKQRFEYSTAALRVKRVTKSAARAQTETARERLQACTAEVRAKMDELKPMRDTLQKQRDAGASLKSLRDELSVTTEEQLDDKVAEMEYKISHEVMPIAEEKKLVRQIKLLKQSREQVIEFQTRQMMVAQSKEETEGIRAHLKAMSGEVDVLRAQEEVARQIFLKFKEEEKSIDNEINAILAEREEVRAEKDAVYEELKKSRGGKAKEDREWYKSRKLIRQVRELGEKGEFEAAQELCNAQVERMHERLADPEYRTEYFRLLEKQNPNKRLMDDFDTFAPPGGAPNKPAAKKPSAVPTMVSQVKAEMAEILSISLTELMDAKAAENAPEPSEESFDEPEVENGAAPVPEPEVVAPKPERKVKKHVVEMPEIPDYEVEIPKMAREQVDEVQAREQAKAEELRKAQEAEERKRKQAEKAAARKQQAEEKARQAAEAKAARKVARKNGEPLPEDFPKKAAPVVEEVKVKKAAEPKPEAPAPASAVVPEKPALKRRVKGKKVVVAADGNPNLVEVAQEWLSDTAHQLFVFFSIMCIILAWLIYGSR